MQSNKNETNINMALFRKKYTPPSLTSYGSLTAVTASGNGYKKENMGMHMHSHNNWRRRS